MKPRRRARSLLLEVLYEYDLAEHDPVAVFQRRIHEDAENEQRLSNNAMTFARDMLLGVINYQPQIDMLITRFAPEWPLDQVAIIDRNILRIAIYEVLVDVETPVRVAINEAVELAKTYGADASPRFVNGVLGTLTEQADTLREEISREVEVAGGQ